MGVGGGALLAVCSVVCATAVRVGSCRAEDEEDEEEEEVEEEEDDDAEALAAAVEEGRLKSRRLFSARFLVFGVSLVFSSACLNSISVICERGGAGIRKKKARMKHDISKLI